MARSLNYLKAIGIFKLVCTALLVAAAIGVLHLFGHDVEHMGHVLIAKLHLDPEDHYVTELLAKASGVSQNQLIALDAGLFFYAILYGVEGIGLIKGKHWAEYLTIVATSVFIPLEIYELIRRATLLKCGILAVNLLIVLYLVQQLRRERY